METLVHYVLRSSDNLLYLGRDGEQTGDMFKAEVFDTPTEATKATTDKYNEVMAVKMYTVSKVRW